MASVNISISPNTINIGEPVTVTYSTEGFQDTQITLDNLANPIDLGGGDQSGSFKTIPIYSGSFSASIVGTGLSGRDSFDGSCLSASDSCSVN